MKEMKRLIFAVFMMICSVSWAKWELIGEAGDNDEIHLVYVDKSTIRKNGVIAKIWILKDYSSMQTESTGDRYKSAKVLNAYNCREETSALISLIDYSGSEGEGNVTYSLAIQEKEWVWRPVAPGTSGEAKWKIACGKK